MSEEEIRKILLCENIGELAYCGLLDKLDGSNNNDLNELKKQAIQGLLDLYYKEKEKNKELETENMIMRTVDKQYIAKDKIREEIKEAEGYLDNAKENSTVKEYELVIEFLEELLEE